MLSAVQRTMSDEDGVFTIEDVPLPDVALTVSKDGFEPETILVQEGESSVEDTKLGRR